MSILLTIDSCTLADWLVVSRRGLFAQISEQKHIVFYFFLRDLVIRVKKCDDRRFPGLLADAMTSWLRVSRCLSESQNGQDEDEDEGQGRWRVQGGGHTRMKVV